MARKRTYGKNGRPLKHSITEKIEIVRTYADTLKKDFSTSATEKKGDICDKHGISTRTLDRYCSFIKRRRGIDFFLFEATSTIKIHCHATFSLGEGFVDD